MVKYLSKEVGIAFAMKFVSEVSKDAVRSSLSSYVHSTFISLTGDKHCLFSQEFLRRPTHPIRGVGRDRSRDEKRIFGVGGVFVYAPLPAPSLLIGPKTSGALRYTASPPV